MECVFHNLKQGHLSCSDMFECKTAALTFEACIVCSSLIYQHFSSTFPLKNSSKDLKQAILSFLAYVVFPLNENNSFRLYCIRIVEIMYVGGGKHWTLIFKCNFCTLACKYFICKVTFLKSFLRVFRGVNWNHTQNEMLLLLFKKIKLYS